MTAIPFTKMHGLGNDFVVIDTRKAEGTGPLSLARMRRIADRRLGIGCDQVIILGIPRTGNADAFMSMFNADGGEISACGNATRCVARLLMEETGRDTATIQTRADLLLATRTVDGLITVDMGEPRQDWAEIPLAEPADTLSLNITFGPLSKPVAVSMGNPHAVFFVPHVDEIDLAELGPLIEHHPLFPERTNVEIVECLDQSRLRMRVWERGTGITSACGTGACAALVAAVRRGLIPGRQAEVVLDGGSLFIEVLENGRVMMTGPATKVATGTLAPELFNGL